ncbi:MAG: hypothetical protein A2Y41_02625 [Spirochaetes bacterium GWB1_36_13]|nr:MAG: hypothetical protein A2Y41_02625 [Spirochaetes bacterium GWB1_36_13]
MFFEGYHGTDSDSVTSIIKNGYNLSNNKQSLGKGVYFFQDYYNLCNGLEEAKNWAIHVKKFERWSVLKVNIDTEKYIDIFLDVKHREMFDVIKKELIKKHLEAGKNIKTFNENAIFRKLEEQDIDLIRVLVDATKDIGYPKYVVRRPQVQICVKTTKVIVDNILIKQGKRVSL